MKCQGRKNSRGGGGTGEAGRGKGCQELVQGGAGAGGMGDAGFARLGMGPRWR